MTGRILVVRLGAMGDVIHTLPAAATLKKSFGAPLTWIIDPKWAVLLEGNPYVDEVILLNRRKWDSVREAWSRLRRQPYELAVDFQGLIKSALVARASGARRVAGYHRAQAREPLAALAYSESHRVAAAHVVDQYLQLAAAAGAGRPVREFPLPAGVAEGNLPESFVLASPFAGWPSKEWPLENYGRLAAMLQAQTGLRLVLNGHAAVAGLLASVPSAVPHVSSIAGLIDATRRARAVIGVDSGPLHLAAALNKPGVALFGPTDPARNGPFGGSMRVLRAESAVTSYKRRQETDSSMRLISPEAVMDALEPAFCRA